MNLKPNRSCGDCTECCEGWLSANIHGYNLRPGSPCKYLAKGKGCTIYDDRPKEVCKPFKCVWLGDQDYSIPEWMKPNLSKIIITDRYWGDNNEHHCWSVVECGEKMSSDVLHWLLMHCERNNICLEYQFNQQTYRKGSREFLEFMEKKMSEKYVQKS